MTRTPRSPGPSSTSGCAAESPTRAWRPDRGRRRWPSPSPTTLGSACTSFLDERSAAFCALGIGRASGRPAVVLCTSGTAAVNFHPAVVEAHHGRVPLHRGDGRPAARAARRRRGPDHRPDQALRRRGALVRRPRRAGRRRRRRRGVAQHRGPHGRGRNRLAGRSGALEPAVPRAAGADRRRRWSTRPAGPAARRGRRASRPRHRFPAPAALQRAATAIQEHPRGLVVAGWGAATSAVALDRFVEVVGVAGARRPGLRAAPRHRGDLDVRRAAPRRRVRASAPSRPRAAARRAARAGAGSASSSAGCHRSS